MSLQSIMVVDDNTDMLHVYARVLVQEGFEVFTAATGYDCLEQITKVRPDIFLLDVVLPDWNGIDLVREIKGRPEFANSFVVLLSGMLTDSDCKIRGLDAGALDYLARPIANKELVAKVKSLMKVMDFQDSLLNLSKKFEALSITDGLTGIANRRCFDEVIAQEFSRHVRSGGLLTLIMLDVDCFKSFNDHYGHVCGDDCLRQIAGVIDNCMARPGDLVARYGGEEFACILPDTDQRGAMLIAERIRQSIVSLAIPHEFADAADCVSASLGVVTVRCDRNKSASDIVVEADAMLYRAKALGRNRVECNEAEQLFEPGCAKFVQLVWKDAFCSGNQLIDAQHRSLVQITNELLEAILLARPKNLILGIIYHLLDDARQHFRHEEDILKAVRFAGLKQHSLEHEKLLNKAVELALAFNTDTLTVGDIFQFLVPEVVMQHMLLADREFFKQIIDAPIAGSGSV